MVNATPGTPHDAQAIYTRLAATHAAERDRYARQSQRISYARVATFLVGAACLIAAATSSRLPAGPLWTSGGGLLLAFFVLVVLHATVDREQRRHEAFASINELALRKLARDWAHVPVPDGAAPPTHACADDLDLFGRASVFALLWSGGTEPGRRRLEGWLLQPAGPEEIAARQAAVDELASHLELRQQLLALARAGSVASHDVARFLEWAEGPAWLSPRRVAVWALCALTVAILGLIGLGAVGVVDGALWTLPAVVGFIVSNVAGTKLVHLFDRAFANHAVFDAYGQLFELVSSADLRAPLLRDLQAALVVDRLAAHRQMKRLHRLMELADLRRSALVHFPVQMVTLWDFHIVLLVERWQRRAGRAARGWLEALARFEALAALAALRFDHPGWAFPAVEDGEPAFDAGALGHPLLPPAARVDNDVGVGPRGTVLLVTGSNMSGKSTLLRAIGVNVVLAQAGAPVCAARLRMPPVRLHTTMRVQDSLEQGVSFFMAAVNRLKQVVQAADAAGPGGARAPILLYLLDEVLQGTNTAERQIAVRSVLRHLLARPAIGAVTTHDLALAATPDLSAATHAVHFTEHLHTGGEGAVMTFDYRLREGLATSRNALKLMHMVGLEVEEDQS